MIYRILDFFRNVYWRYFVSNKKKRRLANRLLEALESGEFEVVTLPPKYQEAVCALEERVDAQ